MVCTWSSGMSFTPGYCADAGGLRIAGIDRHVHDAATLRSVWRDAWGRQGRCRRGNSRRLAGRSR